MTSEEWKAFFEAVKEATEAIINGSGYGTVQVDIRKAKPHEISATQSLRFSVVSANEHNAPGGRL
jgi:hypothetical protein